MSEVQEFLLLHRFTFLKNFFHECCLYNDCLQLWYLEFCLNSFHKRELKTRHKIFRMRLLKPRAS